MQGHAAHRYTALNHKYFFFYFSISFSSLFLFRRIFYNRTVEPYALIFRVNSQFARNDLPIKSWYRRIWCRARSLRDFVVLQSSRRRLCGRNRNLLLLKKERNKEQSAREEQIVLISRNAKRVCDISSTIMIDEEKNEIYSRFVGAQTNDSFLSASP